MRLRSASRHCPSILKYSGYIEVLWKPSGATPSRSTDAQAASGAFFSWGEEKSGA